MSRPPGDLVLGQAGFLTPLSDFQPWQSLRRVDPGQPFGLDGHTRYQRIEFLSQRASCRQRPMADGRVQRILAAILYTQQWDEAVRNDKGRCRECN